MTPEDLAKAREPDMPTLPAAVTDWLDRPRSKDVRGLLCGGCSQLVAIPVETHQRAIEYIAGGVR